jgi:hypothetical protein
MKRRSRRIRRRRRRRRRKRTRKRKRSATLFTWSSVVLNTKPLRKEDGQ